MSITTTTYTYYTTALQATYGELGVPTTYVQRSVIVRNDGAVINFDVELPTLISELVLPKMGDPAAGSGLAQTALCRGYSVTQGPSNQVIVETRYDTQYTINPSSGAFGSRWDLPFNVSFQTVQRSMMAYRQSWTTNPPAGADSTGSDIGGVPFLSAQNGVAQTVAQTRLRLQFTQDAEVVSIVTAAANLTNYANKISNATFMGMASGYVICEGVSIVRTTHEYYLVSFDFLFDPYAHHSQVAELDGDGKVKTATVGGVANAAADVRWKRLARTATDFNNIFAGDATLKALVEKGYWA